MRPSESTTTTYAITCSDLRLTATNRNASFRCSESAPQFDGYLAAVGSKKQKVTPLPKMFKGQQVWLSNTAPVVTGPTDESNEKEGDEDIDDDADEEEVKQPGDPPPEDDLLGKFSQSGLRGQSHVTR
jgi:hypothetical protein